MKKKQTFEEAFKRLEEIAQALEGGELSLDESIAIYEEGIKLINFCSAKLDQAAKKVQKLTRAEDGEFVSEPLDSPEID